MLEYLLTLFGLYIGHIIIILFCIGIAWGLVQLIGGI